MAGGVAGAWPEDRRGLGRAILPRVHPLGGPADPRLDRPARTWTIEGDPDPAAVEVAPEPRARRSPSTGGGRPGPWGDDRSTTHHISWVLPEKFCTRTRGVDPRLATKPFGDRLPPWVTTPVARAFDLGGRLAGLRVWRVEGFEKHLVFYRTAETIVEIVRVLHGARDLTQAIDADELS